MAFEEEVEPTVAELTGEAGESPLFLETPITPDATPPVPPTPEEPAKEAEAVPGKDPAAPTPAPPVTKDERTVPYAALHEERIKRQELTRKLEDLERKLTATPAKTPAEMILEDPESAVASLHQTLKQEIDDLRLEIERRDLEREINTAVPNFLDIAPQMEELLLGEGFSDESIRTMIGSSGKDAPKLFKVLARLTAQPNEESLRLKLTAELTPTITASVTKDLMAKFKIVEGDTNLGKLPGTPPDAKLNIGSEEEFAKLPKDQQERWLAGEI